MALHQPFGVWQKILWKLPEHSRRSTACSNRQKYSKPVGWASGGTCKLLTRNNRKLLCNDAATSPLAVQNKLDQLNREFDRLLLLIGDEENVFLEKKLQKVNNEILSLVPIHLILTYLLAILSSLFYLQHHLFCHIPHEKATGRVH